MKTKRFEMRFSEEDAARIDEWRWSVGIDSRAEAIRKLVNLSLDGQPDNTEVIRVKMLAAIYHTVVDAADYTPEITRYLVQLTMTELGMTD